MKMKKFAAAILTGVVSLCLFACGQSASSVDAVSVGEKVMESATGFPKMQTITSSDSDAEINFSTLCDFDYSKVASYYYAFAADGTAPEIAVVSLKDAADTAELMTAIKAHERDREGTMQEYSQDQVQLVQSYILLQQKGTVGYFIGKGAASLEDVFRTEVG